VNSGQQRVQQRLWPSKEKRSPLLIACTCETHIFQKHERHSTRATSYGCCNSTRKPCRKPPRVQDFPLSVGKHLCHKLSTSN